MKLISNLDKPGKGIKKTRRQKKDPAQFLSLIYYHFGTLFKSGLYAFLFSLPLITHGLAETGLAHITRSVSRDKHAFVPSDGVDAIKKNFRQSAAVSVIDFIILAIFAFNLYAAAFVIKTQLYSSVLYGFTVIGFTLFSFSRFYRQFIIITFSKPLREVYRDSFALGIIGFKRNFIAGAILTLCYVIAFALSWYMGVMGFMIDLILYATFFRWFRSVLVQFTVFPVVKKYLFDPYYNSHPDEDREKRYNLGLLTADEYFGPLEGDEEPINWDIMFK